MRSNKNLLTLFSLLLTIISFNIKIYGQVTNKEAGDQFILVNSAPEGAEIFINEEYIGITPLVIRKNLDKSKFILMLKHKDYPKFEEEYSDVRSIKEFFIILDKNCSVLNITTEPVGATIKINNRELGKTPIYNIMLPLGENWIEIEKENFVPLLKRVFLNNKQEHVHYKMDYQFSFVSFSETASKGKNTSIFIDGKVIPGALIDETKITYGDQQVMILSDAFYKNINKKINFEPGKKYSIGINYDRHTLKYIGYSAVIPGLGQFLDGSVIKGAIWGTTAIVDLFLIISTNQNYNEKINEYNNNLLRYEKTKLEDDVLYYRNLTAQNESEANKLRKNRNLYITGLLGIYLLNILDAALFHTRDYEINITENSGGINNGLGSINFRVGL